MIWASINQQGFFPAAICGELNSKKLKLNGKVLKMKKRIVAVILSFMLVIPAAGIGFAYADTTQVSFSFSFGAQPNLEHTSVRAKANTSQMYMNATSIPAGKSYVAGTWGRNSLTDTTDRATNPATSAFYFSPSAKSQYMTNYVKQSYNYGVIRAAQNGTYSFNASGKWSVDS
jgi:hypothetical protein